MTASPSTALATVLGAGLGLGVWLVATGLQARPPSRRRPLGRWLATRLATARGGRSLPPRVVLAVLAGVLAGAATGWVVAAVSVAALVWAAPRLAGGAGEHRKVVERIQAIATWTELLRDTLTAAAGLEQAVLATAEFAPAPIRREVAALAARIEDGASLPVALRAFARELDDPTGELVTAALLLAAEQQARQLADLLGELATAARGQVAMRLRVETGRARTRTSVRVIVGTTTAFAAGLVALNRDYLAPYDSATGQLVLVVVVALFAAGFGWLERMSRLSGMRGRVLSASSHAPASEEVGPR